MSTFHISPSRAAALVALLALVSACQSDDSPTLEEACRDVSCGAGSCALTASGPICLCDEGHHAEGLRCVSDTPPPPPDPCEPGPPCEDDHGDDEATATTVSLPAFPVEGTFEVGEDVDAFLFVPFANHQYRVSCQPGPGLTGCQQVLFRQGAATGGIWQVGELRFDAPDATPFVLLVRGSAAGTYALQLEDLGEDDHPDGTTDGSPLVVDGPAVTGTLPVPEDVDAFTFTSQARHVYRFECSDSGARVEFRLRNPAGEPVGTGVWVSRPFLFSPEVDGAHTLQLRPYSGELGGTYSCQLTDQGLDDHGNTRQDATPLVTGEGTANLQYDADVDVFSASTVPGTRYRATLTSSATLHVKFFVSSASGDTLAYTLAQRSPVELTFTATTATTSFLVSNIPLTSVTSTWTLTLEEAVP